MILDDKKLVVMAAVIFTLLFLLFYPNFYHYPDEQTYLRNVYLIGSGFKVSNPLYSYGYGFNGTDYVSAYPPLQSLFIAPFALFDWKLAFFSGLFLHLLNFFILYKILQKLKLPVGYSVLYLFFPAMVLLSTTLQAEMSSITCMLLAAYFYLGNTKKSFFLTGFFAGLSVLARYTNVLLVIAFLAVILWKERQKALHFIAGTIPSAATVLLYNASLYGSPFSTAYSLLGHTKFLWPELLIRVPYFILLFSIIFPLMFFAMFFAKNKLRDITIVSSIFFLLLWGSYFFSYTSFRIEDFAVGIDKFAPVIPLMLVCYAEALQGVIKKFNLAGHLNKIVALALILLVASSFVVMSEHKKKQDLKYSVFQDIYSKTGSGALIIVDEEIPSLSGKFKETPFTGMFFMEPFGDRKLASIKDDYKKYITDESNTFYMRIWMSPNIEIELLPFAESRLAKQ